MQNEEMRRTLFERDRYFDLYEQAPVGYILLSAEGLVQEANLTAASLLGVTKSELHSRPFTDFVFRDDQRIHYLSFRKLLGEGRAQAWEVRMMRKGAEVFWVRIESSLGRDAAGSVVCRYVLVDITERKQNEAELRQQEDASGIGDGFRLLAEAIPQIVWICSADGLNIYFNQHWMDYTGLTLEESYGHGWNKPFHPDDQQIAWDAWQNATNNKAIYALECRLRRFDGVYKWWLIRGESLCDEHGTVLKWFGTCTDIDDLKQAEKAALRESEEQFETLANSIPQLCWMANADGWLFWYNQRWYDYTGTTPEQMEGWGWQRVHDPEALPKVLEQWKTSIATGQSFDMVFPLRGADGAFRQFLTRVMPVRDLDGNVVRWCGTNTDVTERQLAEEALRESEARERERAGALETAKQEIQSHLNDLQFIVEATDLGIWSNEVPLQKMNWNRQVKEHFWLPPDSEPVLDDFFNILHPDDREPSRLAIERAIAEHRKQDLTYRTVAPDGRVRWVHAQGRAIYGENGQPVRFSGITQDITEFKKIENALREAEERYRTLFQSSSAIKLLIDPENRRIVDANPAACEYYGYPREELLTLTIDQINTLPREAVMAKMAEAVKQSRCCYEFEHRLASGETREVEVRSGPILLKGKALLYSIIQDITYRKMMAKALEAARNEAEGANRAKSEFLANMSHEIRTPMNGVLGMTELALMEDNPMRVREYLQIVKQSGKTLLDIINDILDLSKIESGKVVLESEPFAIRTILETTLRPLSALALAKAKAKELSLRHHVDQGVPEHLIGDQGRLRQVLTNLVGNALKFTHEGGVLVVVDVDSTPSPNSVRLLFKVKDSGIGIAKDKLEEVFEAFSQAGLSSHAKYGGTGLGLSISKSLVEMMGGRIWVKSEAGQGSTFSFTATFGLAEVQSQPEPSAGPGVLLSTDTLRILVAEDDPVNQLLAVRLLETHGHQATIAENGLEAIEKLKAGNFDVVLMDARMPEMTGEEAVAAIRNGMAGLDKARIPVVALTANALKGDRERFLAAGMDDYLSKPFDIEELNQILENVLANRDKGPDKR
jgi:PAS domain S-box-containing protein